MLPGEFEREVAYKSVRRALAASRRPAFDAVFAGNDDAAIGAIHALQESGYRIPEDIPVAGFDDLRLSGFLTPSLTTVHAPTEDVGRLAAEQVLCVIEGEEKAGITLLPTELIIRRSCGCEV
jgi:DNA-binding LacI/PurR family transcriptional regulator